MDKVNFKQEARQFRIYIHFSFKKKKKKHTAIKTQVHVNNNFSKNLEWGLRRSLES